MIGVAERTGERSDAAPLLDQSDVIQHTHDVRSNRTPVNVENVNPVCELVYVPELLELGAKLINLRQRSRLSYRDIARLGGWAGASSVQRYLDGSYDGDYLPVSVARRLADAMEGKGEPPITRQEIMELAAFPVMQEGAPFKMEGASQDRMKADVPVYGTALGASKIVDGEAIEQTTLNKGEIVTYFRRPTILDGRVDIYGLFVQGSSMSPRFEDGETVFVETTRPPKIADDVVVYLVGPDEHEAQAARAVLVKRLVRRTAEYVELEQFSPAKTFRIPREMVGEVHRIIPWSELVT